ncbi:MAG: Sau3AI family type II restriction endonuclease, partial [Bacilli bacterium]
MKIYNSEEELMEKARTAIGKTFSKLNSKSRNIYHKGGIGQLIEEEVFEYKVNNKSEPDIANLKIEIKVTPYIIGKNNKKRAKERLVLGIIDYNKEANIGFYNSSFWKKNENLLIMTYESKKNTEQGDLFVDSVYLFKYPEEDLKIIKEDFNIINEKIKMGLAHEISEGDTMYLGACTKGVNASTTKTQPFSNIPAKQRAYSLKQSYMSYIINSYIFKDDVNYLKSISKISELSIYKYTKEKIDIHLNRKCSELYIDYNINPQSKSRNYELVIKMLGFNSNDRISEFEKANIEIKALRVDRNMKPKEHISLPHFKFNHIVK